MLNLNDSLLDEHYAHIIDKPFFADVKKFMRSSPVIAQCWEGLDVVSAVRLIAGVTKSREALAGTIRGDLAMSVSQNVLHCSDSLENAQKEVNTFFKDDELFAYDKSEWTHVYGLDEMGE